MKLSSRTWVILLFVLILAGAVVLYMMYKPRQNCSSPLLSPRKQGWRKNWPVLNRNTPSSTNGLKS